MKTRLEGDGMLSEREALKEAARVKAEAKGIILELLRQMHEIVTDELPKLKAVRLETWQTEGKLLDLKEQQIELAEEIMPDFTNRLKNLDLVELGRHEDSLIMASDYQAAQEFIDHLKNKDQNLLARIRNRIYLAMLDRHLKKHPDARN